MYASRDSEYNPCITVKPLWEAFTNGPKGNRRVSFVAQMSQLFPNFTKVLGKISCAQKKLLK